MQAKVLRVLEDGSMRRVGSLQERRVDVRIISATNRDLERDVEQGRFREDLLYRINVLSIDLPPLREREGDVELLVARFLGPQWSITDEALELLKQYRWPGNVRQLINVIERAKILAENATVRVCDLPKQIVQAAPPAVFHLVQSAAVTDDLSELQRAKVIEVLHREAGNKTRAARALGLSRRSLYRLLDKFDIDANGVAVSR